MIHVFIFKVLWSCVNNARVCTDYVGGRHEFDSNKDQMISSSLNIY